MYLYKLLKSVSGLPPEYPYIASLLMAVSVHKLLQSVYRIPIRSNRETLYRPAVNNYGAFMIHHFKNQLKILSGPMDDILWLIFVKFKYFFHTLSGRIPTLELCKKARVLTPKTMGCLRLVYHGGGGFHPPLRSQPLWHLWT